MFVGHRNQPWVMVVLSKMGNQLKGYGGLGKCTGNWIQTWVTDSIHVEYRQRESRKVEWREQWSALALQGPCHLTVPSHALLTPGPQVPINPHLLLCSTHAHILDSSYFTSSLFSWAQWCCKSFSQPYNLKEPLSHKTTLTQNHSHKTTLTSGTNCKFKEFPRYLDFW